MWNFYNGIGPNSQGLLDVAAEGALLPRTIEDAKSIIERMTTGSSTCAEVDARARDQSEKVVEENR